MKTWIVVGLLVLLSLVVYWPHNRAEFVLDDQYSVVRNPLIKNPSLYKDIWISRLFDAHQSSGYIKFGYYRPVLESSWILDYSLFGLKASGFQWVNLLIHFFNCWLIYLFLLAIFENSVLALKASLFFCILPTQEWVVRYVTGRGDELSALFALLSLLALLWVLKTGSKQGYILVIIGWLLACLTREVAISYILYAFLVYYSLPLRGECTGGGMFGINRFSLFWILIGLLPFLLIWTIIPKQGNILVFHVFYFVSIGLCLWMGTFRLRWVVILIFLFSGISFYQGQFWTTEADLLRHTHRLECWPRTVVAQQLLMKYEEDIPAIKEMEVSTHDPLIKAMWLRRLGLIYFTHNDLAQAQEYFLQSLGFNPMNVDILNALAVVCHERGQEDESLVFLKRSFEINPTYPDTLRTLGIYYYIHKDLSQARGYLTRCLFYDPNNTQARELLRLANPTN